MSIITTDYGLIKPTPGCTLDFGHPINRGLVGCWLFNEKNGLRLTDYSSYKNHGTLTNFAMNGATSNWVGSPTGGCLNFDGTNDYADIGTNNSIRLTSVLSLTAIVKVPSGANFWTIIGGKQSNNCYQIGIQATTGTIYIIKQNVAAFAASTTPIPFNTLTHVGVTYNGTITKFYINGVFINSVSSAQTFSFTDIMCIGTRFDSGSVYQAFSGYLDNVKLYNRVLSELEVQQIYSQPNIGIQSPTYYTQ